MCHLVINSSKDKDNILKYAVGTTKSKNNSIFLVNLDKIVLKMDIKSGCFAIFEESELVKKNDFSRFEIMDPGIPEGPDAFVRTVKRPEEMSYWQLKRYAERVSLEGYDATGYLVDMNIKLSFPVINVIMIIIGTVIALGVKKGGTAVSVSIGVIFCFLYLVTLGFTRALGISGVLPPSLSAWMANIIFLLFGSWSMIHMRI